MGYADLSRYQQDRIERHTREMVEIIAKREVVLAKLAATEASRDDAASISNQCLHLGFDWGHDCTMIRRLKLSGRVGRLNAIEFGLRSELNAIVHVNRGNGFVPEVTD